MDVELSEINEFSSLWRLPSCIGNAALDFTVNKVKWFIENRGGLAYLIGKLLVPSQFICPKADESNKIVDHAIQNSICKIERFSLPVQGSGSSVTGIIYTPKDWDPSDHSRAVLYHNPNGVTVSQYLLENELCWTPEKILALENCPIILYDYRGTGLSSEAGSSTYESIVVDGETVLQHAFKNFQNVKVAGSSLGGGVATVSLERHLKAHPEDAARASLINHDSFSTTPKVVLPAIPIFADWAGWVLGGLLDAETSMKNLVARKIPITVLCHLQDRIIPRGARMAEYIEGLQDKENVRVIYSQRFEHAALTQDMFFALKNY